MNKATGVHAAIAAGFGAASAFLGWFGWLAVIFALAMALDWITGSLAATKAGEWSSERAREGCWHKAGSIISVCVAAVADLLIGIIINHLPGVVLPFEYSALVCPIVLVWYIVTELGSIIENAGKMGAPIPAFLRKAIAMLHKATDTAGEKIVIDEDEDGDD